MRGLVLQALPVALLQLLFLAAPLGMTVVLTFQATRSYQLVWVWDGAIWENVFSKPHYWTVLLDTFVMSAICVVLCVVLAFPIAYAMVARLARYNTALSIAFGFSFLTDMTLKTFGLALFLDDRGAANYLGEWAGWGPVARGVLFTDTATMIGMVYNLLPFTIFTLYLSIAAIDRSLILAAYDAGAGKFRAFWEVTLPLSRPGLGAGAVLVFLLAMGTFLESKVLGGGKSPMMADLIRQTFETRVNWPLGAALSLVMMLASALVVLVFARVYQLRLGER